MKFILAIAFLLGCYSLSSAAKIDFPSGDHELDSIRLAVRKTSTTRETFQLRAFKMKLWTVVLQQQGARIDAYLPVDSAMRKIVWWNTILYNDGEPQEFTNDQMTKLSGIVDQGYKILDEVQAHLAKNPVKVIKSDVREVFPINENIDWTQFKGNNGLSGYTGATGPALGKKAWKFPVGLPWESEPKIEGDRVYLSSPGMRTAMYCLDLKTGEDIWTTKQVAEIMGDQLYNTPSNMATPSVLNDYILYRETGSRGNKGPSRHIVYVNKKTGEIEKELVAGHVDYRAGLPAFEANEKFTVFPHGIQDIESVPPIAQAFNRVVCKDTKTGHTLWDYNIGYTFAEPCLDDNRIFIGTQIGYMYALKADGKYGPVSTQRFAWEFKAEGAINERVEVNSKYVFFGDNSGVFYCLDKVTGEVKWAFKVAKAEGRSFRHFSRPFADEKQVVVGAANNMFYCFDIETGKLKFKRKTNDWIRSRPVFKGNRYYFVTMRGTLFCVEYKNGKAIDRFRIQTGDHPIIADIAISDEYLVLNNSDLVSFCYDLDGKEVWKRSLIDAFENKKGNRIFTDQIAGGARYMSKPTAVNGLVYFGTPIRFVYAVDAETGEEIWKRELGGSICGSPVYYEGKIYVAPHSGEDQFYCLDAKTGELIWTQNIGWVWGSPNVVDGMVFVSGIDGNVQGLDAETGAIIWRYRLDRSICSEPATEGDQVFFGSWDHYFYAMNQKSGKVNWKFPLNGGTDSGVAIVKDGKIYLPIGGPRFRRLDAATGKVDWEYFEHGAVFNVTPAVYDSTVYASTWHGFGLGGICVVSMLYAMDKNSGEIKWKHIGGGLSGPVIGKNGDIYIGSVSDPYFYCISPSGETKWMYEMGNKVEESTPALYNGKAYILSSDGYIHAIK